MVTLARRVFDGMGLDINRDFQAVYVEQAAASPRLVLAGEAAGLQGAGEGWPAFVPQATGVARFISPAAPQITRVLQKHALLQAMDEPAGAHAGTYPGIYATLPNVGSVNFILVRSGPNDARAAAFVQVMRARAAQLAAALRQHVASLPHHCRITAPALPQAAFITLANTRAGAPSPAMLHRAFPLAR